MWSPNRLAFFRLLMVKLSDEEIKGLFQPDDDTPIEASSKRCQIKDTLVNITKSAVSLSEAADEITSGGQFSVVASLPIVSASASSASSDVLAALVKVLEFASCGEVYPSDAKDWSFIEDILDELFGRIDECVAADAGRVVKKSLDKQVVASSISEGRPQAAWADLIDNYRSVFVPIIKEKLHAIEPLDPLIAEVRENPNLLGRKRNQEFGNVYEAEIRKCLREVSSGVAGTDSLKEIVEFTDLSSTDLVFVNTADGLDQLIDDVLRLGEVAIDLEHHDVHSYRGFTSLIQISTREKDYIIDPFPLFHSLEKLNKFTTDPAVKKTFHGADMDIQWLQRDFGVYVVNMFDTGQAARVLGLAGGFGLANLLDTFCKVKTNKLFQMADWRMRPLSKDMLNYARIDTHYLLYIRDRLENLVLAMGGGHGGATAYGKKMLTQVFDKSFGVASKVYRDHSCDYDADSIKQFCVKQPALKVGQVRSNPQSMATLRAVLKWRDTVARKIDESRHYVLRNSASLRLANSMPSTVPQLLRAMSFESNGGFPSMRIGTDEAIEILEFISHENEKIIGANTVSAPAHDFEMRSPEVASLSRRSSSSVVAVGGFGVIRKSSEGRKTPMAISLRESSEVVSALFSMFVAKHPSVRSSKKEQVTDSIRKFLNECPATVKDDLEAYFSRKVSGTEPDLQAPRAVLPELEGSEFVSFRNSGKKVSTAEMMNSGIFPETVREQRKRQNEKTPTASAKKKQKKANAAAATMKALEFIEQELSLGNNSKKHM